jgi:glycosyltransferase involved in cell wall biosynthesis
MAQARPVIVSDVGATAELVDASNGWLIPPGDADALYAALKGAAATAAIDLERMGRSSFSKVSERFSWPVVTRSFVGIFRSVAMLR